MLCWCPVVRLLEHYPMLALLWKMSFYFMRAVGANRTQPSDRNKLLILFFFYDMFYLSFSILCRNWGFWAVTANLVQRNALSPCIKWPSRANQTENRPLLYFCCTLQAALANFPLWKPHMAAPDIYLHFRAYERLQCNRASEGLTRYIFKFTDLCS